MQTIKEVVLLTAVFFAGFGFGYMYKSSEPGVKLSPVLKPLLKPLLPWFEENSPGEEEVSTKTSNCGSPCCKCSPCGCASVK